MTARLNSSLLKFGGLLLTIIGVGQSAAHGLDLATFDVQFTGSGVGDVTGVRVSILDQLPGPGPAPSYRLFEDLTFTPADLGSTFTVTSVNDGDFPLFEQMITNGANDGFGYWVDALPSGGGVGHSWDETHLLAPGTRSFGPGNFTSIGQLSGPDYAGYDISAVSLTINTFTLNSGPGFYSLDFRAVATIVAIPEPGSATLLLGATALGFGIRRRRSS